MMMARTADRRLSGRVVAMLIAMCILALSVTFTVAPPALAAETTVDDGSGGSLTVSDDITRLDVAKLDASSHDYVSGASMAVVEKDTGTIVAEWTTGSSIYEVAKELDVDTHYILREVSAPSGYDTVSDVEFYVDSSESEGITIVSGTAGEYELTGAYTIALYDSPSTVEEEAVVHKASNTTRTVAPKTGDETPLAAIAVIGVVCLGAAIALQFVKRRIKP